ncbi:MAG: GNAT family N-acetyltransferase [Burkholderiaceae bacterium]|nr:GNAT family N-acetyltransferase [Burkholderiaceae bacterium]
MTLRRATPDDAPAFVALMADPQVFGGLMQLPFPSEAQWRQRLEGSDNGSAELSLVAERDGDIVGSAGLHPVGPAVRRRHVAIIGISVRPDAQGQGVGTALMQALCDYADRWAHILRIELGVYTDNVRAIALYRRFGFEVEGTHRGYALRDGVFVDSHTMARLHPNPPKIRR